VYHIPFTSDNLTGISNPKSETDSTNRPIHAHRLPIESIDADTMAESQRPTTDFPACEHRLFTQVYRRSKNAPKVSLSPTFRVARRDCQAPELDRQVVLCEADRTLHVVLLGGQDTSWHYLPKKSHIDFRPMFTISGGQSVYEYSRCQTNFPRSVQPVSECSRCQFIFPWDGGRDRG
jgi:hypothetical protein